VVNLVFRRNKFIAKLWKGMKLWRNNEKLSYDTLYDSINSFNNICAMLWLIHTTTTTICNAVSVTAKIVKSLTWKWFKTFLSMSILCGFTTPVNSLFLLLFITIIFDWFFSTQFLCSTKKKKRRAVGGDKNGRGLRQFSMKGFSSVLFNHFDL